MEARLCLQNRNRSPATANDLYRNDSRSERMTPPDMTQLEIAGPSEISAVCILPGEAQAMRPPAASPAMPGRSAESSFAGHLLVFSLANLISLVCNGVLTFLLPRWLSMESYGYYRLFILYGGFVGVLHLGLLDGALIRWAARSRQRMNVEVRRSLVFLLIQHAVFLVPAMAILLVWFRHQPWFVLAAAIVLYALVWNAAILGQFALQADKSFGLLSAVTVIHPALLLGIVAGLTHWRSLTLEALLGAYLAAWLAAGVGVWIVLLAKFPGKKFSGESFSGKEEKESFSRKRMTRKRMTSAAQAWRSGVYNIRVGWSVLVAGLLTNLALSLDRVAVSLSFSIRDFAIYSLAATALAVVNTIILSVSRVVFPYLSDGLGAELRIQAYDWGEATLMSLWALSLAGYFPLRVLIEHLLPAYQMSLPILRLLMLATGMTAVIYILHANYFRSSRRQTALLVGASVGLGAAALFLAIARYSHHLVNMSAAMLAAVALWWTVDELLLRRQMVRSPLDIAKTLLFVSACGGAFLLCAAISSPGLGALAYCGLAAVLTAAAYGHTLRSLPHWPTKPRYAIAFARTASENENENENQNQNQNEDGMR
jgi:O-antigen/teichoic acid export membrane protein